MSNEKKNNETKMNVNEGKTNEVNVSKGNLGMKIFTVIAVILVAVIAFFVYKRITLVRKTDTKPIPTVRVEKMEKGNIHKESSVVGVIKSDNIYYVVPKISGEITKIYVKNGDIVKKDDKICEIDNKKSIDAAKIKLDATSSAYNRASKLYSSGDISKQDFEAVKAEYDGARLAYDTQVEFSTILAAGDGTIESTNMTINTLVSQGTNLCLITSDGGKEVQFGLTDRVLRGVNVGDEVELEKAGQKFKAIVKEKANLADTSTGLFVVRANIVSDNQFSSGVYCKVTVVYEKSENVYTINKSLIYYDEEKPYVYVVTPEKKVKKVFIEVGLENEDKSEVKKGLSADDKILATWSNDIMDGVSVNVIE